MTNPSGSSSYGDYSPSTPPSPSSPTSSSSSSSKSGINRVPLPVLGIISSFMKDTVDQSSMTASSHEISEATLIEANRENRNEANRSFSLLINNLDPKKYSKEIKALKALKTQNPVLNARRMLSEMKNNPALLRESIVEIIKNVEKEDLMKIKGLFYEQALSVMVDVAGNLLTFKIGDLIDFLIQHLDPEKYGKQTEAFKAFKTDPLSIWDRLKETKLQQCPESYLDFFASQLKHIQPQDLELLKKAFIQQFQPSSRIRGLDEEEEPEQKTPVHQDVGPDQQPAPEPRRSLRLADVKYTGNPLWLPHLTDVAGIYQRLDNLPRDIGVELVKMQIRPNDPHNAQLKIEVSAQILVMIYIDLVEKGLIDKAFEVAQLISDEDKRGVTLHTLGAIARDKNHPKAFEIINEGISDKYIRVIMLNSLLDTELEKPCASEETMVQKVNRCIKIANAMVECRDAPRAKGDISRGCKKLCCFLLENEVAATTGQDGNILNIVNGWLKNISDGIWPFKSQVLQKVSEWFLNQGHTMRAFEEAKDIPDKTIRIQAVAKLIVPLIRVDAYSALEALSIAGNVAPRKDVLEVYNTLIETGDLDNAELVVSTLTKSGDNFGVQIGLLKYDNNNDIEQNKAEFLERSGLQSQICYELADIHKAKGNLFSSARLKIAGWGYGLLTRSAIL